MKIQDYKTKFTPTYRIDEAKDNTEFSSYISIANRLIDDYVSENEITADDEFELDEKIIDTLNSMCPYRLGSPDWVTKLQIKLQLLDMNLLDDVEDFISNDRKVQLYWNDILVIERTHPLLIKIAQECLNMNDDELDNLLVLAKKQ